MTRWTLALLLFLPAVVRAEMWRWTDRVGQVHYSNVPANVPARAREVQAKVGYVVVTTEAPADALAEETVAVTSDLVRIREVRRIRRRLAEIQAFDDQVRARQRARLEAFANSTLLPDWFVADRWMKLEAEQKTLRTELQRLQQGKPTS